MREEPGTDGTLGGKPLSSDTLVLRVFEARLEAKLLGGEPALPRVDRFVLERTLGAGGMGTVWLAHDEALDRRVALKLVHRGSAAAGERMRLREARGLARIDHPNVIGVHDVGEHEGRVWLAMEYVPGRTLRECASELGRDEALTHWLAAGRGLAAIHAAGLVHRDVKPDNVLLGDDGRVRVIDLGLVREAVARPRVRSPGDDPRAQEVVMTPGFVGTRNYAAPEQVRGEPVDARADQYAYSLSLLESLRAARPPSGRPDEPLPSALLAALTAARSVDPAQRFPSMAGLVDVLEAAARRPRAWRPLAALASASLVVVALVVAPCTGAGAPEPVHGECLARAAPPCAARPSEIAEIVVTCVDPSCADLQFDPAAVLLAGDRLPFDIAVDNRTGGSVELRWSSGAQGTGAASFAPGRRPLPPHWTAADAPVCLDLVDAHGHVRSVAVERAVACE